MFYLFPLVLALALSGTIAVSTVNLLDFSAQRGQEVSLTVENQFAIFDNALSEYYEANVQYIWDNESCPPATPSGDPSCVWERVVDPANDGALTTASWEADLVTEHMYLPTQIENIDWVMGSTAEGVYACAQAPFNDVTSRVAQKLINQYSSTDFRVGTACAPGTSLTRNEVQTFSGSFIYLTKWLRYNN